MSDCCCDGHRSAPTWASKSLAYAANMVFIPWAEYGICKHWMLQRCHLGSTCRWQHPESMERKRLWDHHTALQGQQNKETEPHGDGKDAKMSATDDTPHHRELDVGDKQPTDFSFLGAANAAKRSFVPSPCQCKELSKTPFDVVSTNISEQHVGRQGVQDSAQVATHEVRLGHQPEASRRKLEPKLDSRTTSEHTRRSLNHRQFLQGTNKMGAQKRLSNGDFKVVGPHPSTIKVSAPYLSQAAIDARLQSPSADVQERSLAEAKEESLRLQGVAWLDAVRRVLQLPIRTYTTACVYFHKFRIAHPPGTTTGDGYLWSDAAAASLLTACKVEDTLKKSRDILAAAYNLKVAAAHEQVGADDPLFEQPGRVVIGLERLVLEAGSFDFRSRFPHRMLVKFGRQLGDADVTGAVGKLAWAVLTDLHRTFAPLKQTSAALALASLDLAARLLKSDRAIKVLAAFSLHNYHTTRAEVMEVLLDALDHYTHHTTSSVLGPRFSLDEFLQIRLQLNKECDDDSIRRYCKSDTPALPTSNVQNGHPTPVSPPQNQLQPRAGNVSSNLRTGNLQHADPSPGGGTLRFVLSPGLARNEREEVQKYFTEEWEEYEEEIEVPQPGRPPPPSNQAESSRASSDDRLDVRRDHREHFGRSGPPGQPSRAMDRDAERERLRERDLDRDRLRTRDRRHEDERRRGYDDRYDRRYEDDRRRRYEHDRVRR